MEDCGVVVIDIGSYSSKVGYAGDDNPKVVFPTTVGHSKHPGHTDFDFEFDERRHYVGEEASCRRQALSLNCPIEHGIISNWDDMESVWRHIFNVELNAASEERTVLLTEAPFNPKAHREKMTQIMFENLNVPGLSLAVQAALALYASNRMTGISVDCGSDVIHAVPVFEGYVLPHTIQRMDLAGNDLTTYLQKILAERGYSFRTESEHEIVRDIKEKLCYVSLDFDKQQAKYETNTTTVDYELPDGKVISIGNETFRCPELLFKPNLIGKEMDGIHAQINRSAMACDVELRESMYSNITLSGGSSMFPEITGRLQKEITRLAPPTHKVKVHADEGRKYYAWIGGSIYASHSSFSNTVVTRDDYEECGSSIIHRKCY